MNAPPPRRLRVVLVTGLSGGGKASILRALEDIGFEAVDNPPLPMLEEMVSRSERKLAIGVDARTRGFNARLVLQALDRLRANPGLRLELVYAWADETTLLRRYTETRRRHPLAPDGRVTDGIAAEQAVTAPLREGADLVVDTSELPIAALRRMVERHFGTDADAAENRLVVSLVSFAFPRGLPPDADLVFDTRFLRNPHYDPILQPRTGLDPDVGAHIRADPDFPAFFGKVTELVEFLLPRFVQEGKKYATITFGCTGGRHRSVYLAESLAAHLASRVAAGTENRPAGDRPAGDRPAGRGVHLHVAHRELAREGHGSAFSTERPATRRAAGETGGAAWPSPIQAQEA